MQDKIELLDVELLNDKENLKVIDHWLSVMNWPNGWHYDLDIIWILQNIERMKLAKGSTIIDAGAGLGMTQFILASKGYNVISLDFTDRQIPRFSKNIFTVETVNRDLGNYTHEYMEFMKYGQKPEIKEKKNRNLISLLKKIVNLNKLQIHIYTGKNIVKQTFNLAYLLETMRNHKDFGKITFLRGTFNNIPLEDNTADALVSVSAFEHNTFKDMAGSVREFERVIKKGSPMFITTSAAQNEDWYFEPPKAWNFSLKTLSSWFNIPSDKVKFDYPKVFKNISNSKILKKRMSPFYKLFGNNALPYGNLKEAKYIPVGIVKVKENDN